MGATQSANADRWTRPSEKLINQAKLNQHWSIMIQLLSKDVNVQYQCYQPYLLLKDIIRLHRTCQLWCHWIRSHTSAIHRIPGRRRMNEGLILTVCNWHNLENLCKSTWIQSYLYGRHISPPDGKRTNSWMIETPPDSILSFRKPPPPPPLLSRLAELKQIQHITLDHILPKEITSERIKTYFVAVAPTLRSLELFPTINSAMCLKPYFDVTMSGDRYVELFLEQLYLLINLEELRFSLRAHVFNWTHLEQLSQLPRFHTFICKNEGAWASVDEKYPLALGRCTQLKHCSFGRFELDAAASFRAVGVIMDFLVAHHQSRQYGVYLLDNDPLEYLDLSSILIGPNLLNALAQYAPNLTDLHGRWNLAPDGWSLLTKLKCLEVTYSFFRILTPPIATNHIIGDLIQCHTIETLTLKHLKSTLTEVHLRAILSNLTELTDLTLTEMKLENVAGFAEPNRLRRLVLDGCHGLSLRTTLPSIPNLTHLTLAEILSRHNPNMEIELTRKLFQRMRGLITGKFDDKWYKRTDQILDL